MEPTGLLGVSLKATDRVACGVGGALKALLIHLGELTQERLAWEGVGLNAIKAHLKHLNQVLPALTSAIERSEGLSDLKVIGAITLDQL